MPALLAFLPGTAMAQLSPGPLSRAHAALEGSANCLLCHDPDEGVSATRCLDCHEQLRRRVEARRGLHALPGYADCAHCHPEHAGTDFELVWWGEGGRVSFDHEVVGWSLDGRHAGLDCGSCHRPELIADGALLAAADVSTPDTFLGLSAECSSCHFDEHRGQLGDRSCDACHVTAAWSPAPAFEHATAFALRGAHAAVDCQRCHPRRSVPPADGIPGVPVQAPRLDVVTRYAVAKECAGCHTDPHAGRFRPSGCGDCHSESAWQPVSSFDHGRTRYPLTGLHRRVACDDCHRTAAGAVYRGLSFGACSDCHADPHEARLGNGCDDCHATDGWDRDRDAFDHGRTRYPLRGRHREVDCDACHRPGEPLAVAGFESCSTCHFDVHVGRLADRPDGGACDACHDVDGFRPARFGLQEHERTRYPLAGAHRMVACPDCHQPVPALTVAAPGFDLAAAMRAVGHAGNPDEVRTPRLRFASLACAGCHVDPHVGSLGAPTGGCEDCHAVAGWASLSFDHAATGFALEGRHAETACRACHPDVSSPAPWPLAPPARRPVTPAPPPARERPAPVLRYADTPAACGDCHADIHAGQFADASSGSCAPCHRPTAWSPATFDHATTRFPLDGAHARTPCAGCHRSGSDGVVRYTDAPLACEGCHTEGPA